MTQTRLYFTTGKVEADSIFAAFETAFEDEGLPIAILEVDEDRDIHEVSLYANGTTAGCLEMLEQVVRRERPRNALDLGTGSAVLAIAVAKLAHIPVLATDIDPVATKVAAANARLNHVKALVET
ncbi:MAG: hypothetical protein E5W09_24165, partial [Mesorhizobium sp.]